MKLFTKITISLVATLALVSCSEDFLDVDSRENIEAIDSNENITPEQFLNGIYGMYTDYAYAFSWLGITEIISDNADKGSSPTDNGADKNLLDNLTFTSTATSVREMWTQWYKTIGRASYSIAFTETYGLQDEEYKDRLVGEAKFLRALTYFYLVRSFGDVTIQGDITIENKEAILDPESNLSSRNSKEEVYAYIEQDLLAAIEVLPTKSEYASKDLGRATKGAAQALLAKVYLYQQDYNQALEYANLVINSGQYGLEANYEDIWREYTENGTESIFEIQARGEVIAHGVQQYSQVQGARGPSGWGWGFNTPTENLVAAFDAEGDEIRKDATIIFAGETLWDGREVSPSVENPRYNEKAYSSANSGAADGDKNIRVIRYAEVLLIKAEAANELGQTSEALSALNQVRQRVELDDVVGLGQIELRQKIWNERRLELAFEHDRWFDLIRTGQAEQAMQANGKTYVNGKHELFPIPENQLIQTPQMTQNPGW
ncbi:RagB/SusD family nutrient uptake outer membrane protein [Mesonia aestuariivivens]|uniref:RagB/SusD family nutrient uptake outer membrane protein n=1 Tax=Mesonia aestuariivivens TaxID=2796128 RepID=A0ABS6W2C0_9FLAO|nr:RagB/SusD family nutrient uptake outer membrane protein [Mesonia aestuariivivens]MBW2961980.1 RagB/SusD family nutrient uptake outer membrane protein [Mesonia aestuariivivens]